MTADNLLRLQPLLEHHEQVAYVRQMLAGLPPNGEIYWHGANGKPCPCLSCCGTAIRMIGDTDQDKARKTRG